MWGEQLTSANCATDAPAALPDGFALPANTPTAIFWAANQLGTPYHFGGSCTDPHSGNPDKQCDCSSLMQAAYRAAGISIPRVTTDQAKAGKPVADPALLLPGDLILIPGSQGTMANPRHVGMYLGEGLVIQTPKTGDVVRITRLSSWINQIAALRRIAAPPARRSVPERSGAADDPGGSVVELQAAGLGELHELPHTIAIGRNGTQPDSQVIECGAIAAVGEERAGLRIG